MSQEDYLAWLDVTSNVAGADVFIDDKSVGAVGKTPLPARTSSPASTRSGSAPRATTSTRRRSTSRPARTRRSRRSLKGSPLGQLDVVGLGIEDSRHPARRQGAVRARPVPQERAARAITRSTVTRPGYKPYTKRITIQPKPETSVKMHQAPKPGRGDAVVAYVRRGRVRRRRHLRRPAGERPARRAPEGDRGRHAAARLQRSAVPARQDLLDLGRRGVRARRHHRADGDLLHVPRQGASDARADRCSRDRAAARGRLRRTRASAWRCTGEAHLILLRARARRPASGPTSTISPTRRGCTRRTSRASARRTTASRSSVRPTSRRRRAQLAVVSTDAPTYSTISYDAKGGSKIGDNVLKLGQHFIVSLRREADPRHRRCGQVALVEKAIDCRQDRGRVGPGELRRPTRVPGHAADRPRRTPARPVHRRPRRGAATPNCSSSTASNMVELRRAPTRPACRCRLPRSPPTRTTLWVWTQDRLVLSRTTSSQ